MTKQQIKTIDISTLTWFDRVNGNTYFAQEITLNFAMPNQRTIINPYQYGYSSFIHFAKQAICNELGINMTDLDKSDIIIRHNEKKALKRELKALSNK